MIVLEQYDELFQIKQQIPSGFSCEDNTQALYSSRPMDTVQPASAPATVPGFHTSQLLAIRPIPAFEDSNILPPPSKSILSISTPSSEKRAS